VTAALLHTHRAAAIVAATFAQAAALRDHELAMHAAERATDPEAPSRRAAADVKLRRSWRAMSDLARIAAKRPDLLTVPQRAAIRERWPWMLAGEGTTKRAYPRRLNFPLAPADSVTYSHTA
jgi:hypothetical protein